MNVHSIIPREIWAVEKSQWSAAEYAALAVRYAEASAAMNAAVSAKDFARMRSAYLDLAEITDQTAFLNAGLQKAIEEASNRSTKS